MWKKLGSNQETSWVQWFAFSYKLHCIWGQQDRSCSLYLTTADSQRTSQQDRSCCRRLQWWWESLSFWHNPRHWHIILLFQFFLVDRLHPHNAMPKNLDGSRDSKRAKVHPSPCRSGTSANGNTAPQAAFRFPCSEWKWLRDLLSGLAKVLNKEVYVGWHNQ